MSSLPTGFVQLAYVVPDLRVAMQTWHELHACGPFFLMEHVTAGDLRYRGEPASIDFSLAMAQAGPIQIELIEQHDDAPSAYRDVFAPGEGGVHHVCCFVADYDAAVEEYAALGCPVAHEGLFGDMPFGYVDTRARTGLMTEIIKDCDAIRWVYATVADAAVGWDGSDPIRSLY